MLMTKCRHRNSPVSDVEVEPTIYANYTELELARFAHRTSKIGNIGDKLNIGESVASVCRYASVH